MRCVGFRNCFSRVDRQQLKFDTFRLVNSRVTGRERYQRKALDCVREAERLRDAGERKKLLGVAGLYLCLARHVGDRNDCGTARLIPEHDPEHADNA